MKVVIDGIEIELEPRESKNSPSAVLVEEAYKNGYNDGKIHGYKHAVEQLKVMMQTLIKFSNDLEKSK